MTTRVLSFKNKEAANHPKRELRPKNSAWTKHDQTGETVSPDVESAPSATNSVAEVLLDFINGRYELFHDEHGVPYVSIDNQIHQVNAKRFKELLKYLYLKKKGELPSTKLIKRIIDYMKIMAQFEGPANILEIRVAEKDGHIWYDLGNEAVRITPEGWGVILPPIIFKKYTHQQPQAMPTQGDNPLKILDFVSIPKKDKNLFLVMLISYFVPNIHHPILHIYGPPGAAKTTCCRVVKSLCDPSSTDVLIPPTTKTELIQQLAHHYACVYDNVSDVPGWMSDVLCQACTGAGFSKRKLYTDDDDFVYRFKRCIVFNGINVLVEKTDLLERSIVFELNEIGEQERLSDEKFWETFNVAKPEILGGIFDTISKAMAFLPQVNIPDLNRMADFTRWGYAIAEALGIDGKEFLKDYKKNIEHKNAVFGANSALFGAVMSFMKDRTEWKGYVKDTWGSLAEISGGNRSDRTFPKVPRLLRKYLEEIKVNLKQNGITFEIGDKHNEIGVPLSFIKDIKVASGGS